MITTLLYLSHLLLQLAVAARAILRPHREPASRVAWIVVIAAVPILGIIAYLLFGETNIGRKRAVRARQIIASIPVPGVAPGGESPADVPERWLALFSMGKTINGFPAVGGNTAELMTDSNAGIDRMVADMDAATEHIHLIFYIWLTDNNGLKVVAALKRAASRGVTCRAMADGLGSRAMIASKHWSELREAGVRVGIALPIGNPLLRPLHGRIDLRNHRKIVVIDGRITYCGSQNCADPEFRVKPKYAPWVDALIRFEGPIVQQNQYVFAADWMTYVDEDVRALVEAPSSSDDSGFLAQVIATGPTVRNSAMPETFVALMQAARRELIITTPYFVPNESMQAALCASAFRGIDTRIIFPARNDSWQVAAASRSYYLELLTAGVTIYEFAGGLLHTKSMTVDGIVTLIGSANMDRRSFDLNYENNILLHDEATTTAVRDRQMHYLESSKRVDIADVEAWRFGRRLWNNTVGMLGPLL